MNYGYSYLNYGYPKIHFWISKNLDELWIVCNVFLNRFLDIQKSNYGHP